MSTPSVNPLFYLKSEMEADLKKANPSWETKDIIAEVSKKWRSLTEEEQGKYKKIAAEKSGFVLPTAPAPKKPAASPAKVEQKKFNFRGISFKSSGFGKPSGDAKPKPSSAWGDTSNFSVTKHDDDFEDSNPFSRPLVSRDIPKDREAAFEKRKAVFAIKPNVTPSKNWGKPGNWQTTVDDGNTACGWNMKSSVGSWKTRIKGNGMSGDYYKDDSDCDDESDDSDFDADAMKKMWRAQLNPEKKSDKKSGFGLSNKDDSEDDDIEEEEEEKKEENDKKKFPEQMGFNAPMMNMPMMYPQVMPMMYPFGMPMQMIGQPFIMLVPNGPTGQKQTATYNMSGVNDESSESDSSYSSSESSSSASESSNSSSDSSNSSSDSE